MVRDDLLPVPNMARLVPQVPGMTYAHDGNDLYITFFAESRTEVELNGALVKVEQKTAYPNDGEISVAINPAKPTKFRLRLRIPSWVQDRFVPGELYRYADASFNGKPKATASGVDRRTNTDAFGLPLNEKVALFGIRRKPKLLASFATRKQPKVSITRVKQ